MRWLCALLAAALAVSAYGRERTLMVLGDSLSTGYGFERERGWVSLLAQRLERTHPAYRVVNASISGETTHGARSRLPAALERHDPDVVIVELGGNDGLRGIPLAETRRHLEAILDMLREGDAVTLLVGMRLPPNYGPRYTEAFEAMYRELARDAGVTLVPFLLEGVATDAQLMQPDGIHPQAQAQPRILANVWPHLEPLL
ncbi:MAG: arylesterase [Gammaproteobacteria bacterium]|nr:arylesterase [Gammaproteobacteria bacterium]NIR85977.1 arylesterase [Gammaproteobacteria bacterium]NIR91968.1 arylesterase [Gammaproteobacteria bacterium]NIU07218.1 arylesterase [Gammaproteobacteria bacterium]NIV54021.1 arylesterase [Gammaproteobacteria bacterium]